MKHFVFLCLSLVLSFSLFVAPVLAYDAGTEVTTSPAVTESVDVSPSPVPSVDVSTTSETDLLEQQLIVLGNIQGYLIFSLVVLLCFFVYKFFRMFF